MNLDQKIGENLRRARSIAGLAITDAAICLGLPELELKQYEAGLIRIPSRVVHRAARAFGLEIRCFFETGVSDSEASKGQTSTVEATNQILQSLRTNKTLSKLCEAMRESDYTAQTQKFVA
ncbi:MAG: helix-turn-helix domain-containing protein [Hyphomonas sp.]|nr:helix-turn-helix domain-containing protein [Hyphomonas sp.]